MVLAITSSGNITAGHLATYTNNYKCYYKLQDLANPYILFGLMYSFVFFLSK